MKGIIPPLTLTPGIGDNPPTATLHYGQDVKETLRTLPEAMVHTACTSPPYWGLRDYGADGQIGLEGTPEAYVQALVEVFREVKRVLRPDGTLWVNLGDSYAGSGKGTWDKEVDKSHVKEAYLPSREDSPLAYKVPEGLKPKDLVGIPWRVAFALQADGWYLRSAVPWVKRNCMPSSVRDRPTTGIEYIFLFAHPDSGGRYYYDVDAVRQAPRGKPQRRYTARDQTAKGAQPAPGSKNKPPNYGVMLEPGVACTPENGRNRRDTDWFFESLESVLEGEGWVQSPEGGPLAAIVNPRPYRGAHFATWPPDLVRPMVLAGCPIGGVVLDPFSGTATTGMVALQEGRHYIGTDINPEYLALAEKRISLQNSVSPADVENDIFSLFSQE